MEKFMSLFLCTSILLLFSSCNSIKIGTSLIPENVNVLIVESSENQILIELPDVDNKINETERVFIKDFIQCELELITGEKFDLCYACKENDDIVSDYSNYCINIKTYVMFSSDDFVSIVFDGLLNKKSTAHPVRLFFTLNYNPKTLKTIPFSNICNIDESFYPLFLKKAEEKMKSQYGLNYEDVYATLSVQCLEKESLLQNIIEGNYYYFFTGKTIGISVPVIFALGDHIEIEIPYDNQTTAD